MDNREWRYLRSIDRSLRTGGLVICLVVTFWALRDILVMVFAAVLAASALRGAASFLHRKTGLNSEISLLIVCLSILLSAGTFLGWRGFAMAGQAAELIDHLQSQADQLWETLHKNHWGGVLADQLRGAARNVAHNLGGYLPGIANSLLGIGGSIVVIAATAIFLASSPALYINGSLSLLPPAWRGRAEEVMCEIGATLQRWFLGQLLDMIVVACLSGLGLFLLGVPFAMTLALIAGLLNFIPYLGALAGSLPAILMAFSQSPTQALWVALLFLAVQLLEGNLLAPVIQRRAAYLPPVVTILSQTVLGSLFGIMGLVFATPLAAAILVAVRMVYIETMLEGGHKRDA